VQERSLPRRNRQWLPAWIIRLLVASQFECGQRCGADLNNSFCLALPGIANAFRARARRDMTVPIGKAVISEI